MFKKLFKKLFKKEAVQFFGSDGKVLGTKEIAKMMNEPYTGDNVPSIEFAKKAAKIFNHDKGNNHEQN